MKKAVMLLVVMCLSVWMNMGVQVHATGDDVCRHPNMTQQGSVSSWSGSHTVKLSESSGTQTCHITYSSEEVYLYCSLCGHKVHLDTYYHESHSVCPINF